ncbi:MAG: VPGUxxT family thioredoxin-like (seleno)protein, type 2, partial [Phycisphaerae bacterium]
MTTIATTMFFASCSAVVLAGAQPQELGAIRWQRDFSAAVKDAEARDLPLLVLFQEVPGCSTCKDYGDQVLRHPLLVEAAETLFVPVAVYNNVPEEAALLKSFDEPSWNNPVVRIIDSSRKPLSPRVADDYSLAGLASAMVVALKKAERPVPSYLALLATEASTRRNRLETATFAMHCFWEGEKNLGTLDGVVDTRPGFLGGQEVVELHYDPSRISFEKLMSAAAKMQCASHVYARTDAQARISKDKSIASTRTDAAIRVDKEPKYYLTSSAYRHVPMTEMQAARVNAAIGTSGNPQEFLSPRQIALYQQIAETKPGGWPSYVGADFVTAWYEASTRLRGNTSRATKPAGNPE